MQGDALARMLQLATVLQLSTRPLGLEVQDDEDRARDNQGHLGYWGQVVFGCAAIGSGRCPLN